ncbi:trimeric intracellular cation channel family protein [uncultured Formosa sp.]|uniref:trimeric intracellular cation channel family protein n=1 Tax=uncultured Formosa sp. TaxID=255435 RepID=UPI0026134AB2|nr:trimeric intracellular cation channel family protein [uncultured Formosa sp.]
MFYIIDILGTISFAISGVLVALNKRMDAFGIIIIAFVTATGGGMLRDILIGNTPVSWMKNMTYVYVIVATTILAVIIKRKIDYLKTPMFLFDTIGIGLYTLVGIQKGINLHLHPIICISLGTMTACFGGVLRDILCNQIPVIFRKEIYATACILGGISFFLLRKLHLESNLIYLISGVIIIAIRLLAVRFKISLPNVYKDEVDEVNL